MADTTITRTRSEGTQAAQKLLTELLPEANYLQAAFAAMEWCDEEIEKAQARHGEQGRGPIWHSFLLLQPTHDKLRSREVLYRAHCREILGRVAKGEDTRPGTDAEMIVVLHESSLAAPITSGAACLYFRLALRSVPELARALGSAVDAAAYEQVHGHQADDYEADLRRKLRQDSRKPTPHEDAAPAPTPTTAPTQHAAHDAPATALF